MTDWKPDDDCARNFLYIEEVNSNEGLSRRLNGVPTSNTVQSLKELIAEQLANPQGWNNISLAFADKELSDLNSTLSSYGVQDGDTIFFTRSVAPAINPPPYTTNNSGPIVLNNVMFRDLDGKTLTIHGIGLQWKVKQLRKKLGDEKALEIEYYRFLWGGKQLEDERTLESYNFGENCTIHLVMRLRGGGTS
ncbi:hypothetical protein BKA64DRAFT_756715 [Cadophora sp. MPI-SDFR-AT-0126]|nr:hypothetical protein BKA64DRAFT_756715 [Leotiomycetes sp. MPI-SDFR-AT-0126]